jgi:hypothetical protein
MVQNAKLLSPHLAGSQTLFWDELTSSVASVVSSRGPESKEVVGVCAVALSRGAEFFGAKHF